MIIDTHDAFALIASWDRWSGNGYAHLSYPSVSVGTGADMSGRPIKPGDYRAMQLTDEEGQAIDRALARVGKVSPHTLSVTIAYVRADGSCLAVERATGISRKAVGPMAAMGLEFCGEYIRAELSSV